MKVQSQALTVVLALFAGVSHADSVCAAGSFTNLIGTSCTIGGTTYTFSNNISGNFNPAQLIFKPEVTPTSSGFNISGFPAVMTGPNDPGVDFAFYDPFTAVPSTNSIISSSATLNGVVQSGAAGQAISSQSSFAFMGNEVNGYSASNSVFSSGLNAPTNVIQIGNPPPFLFSGFFNLDNYAQNGGATSFTSADFVFNESPSTTVPEGSELGMLAIAAAGLTGALKKKFVR